MALRCLYVLIISITLNGCGTSATTASSTPAISASAGSSTPPLITAYTIPRLTSQSSLNISGTVSEGSTVKVENTTTGLIGDAFVDGGSWQYTLQGLVEGENQLSITATNIDRESSKLAVSITLDSTPPLLAINSVTSQTSSNRQTISGTTELGATVFVKTDTASSGYATISGTNWAYTITNLTEGINTITVTATDTVGNTSTASASINLILTKIIAHRGSSFTAPENTLAAFNLAWQQEVDAVELDIYLSKDNKIMVIHDTTTGRTAGIDMAISTTTSSVLRSLDVGLLKGAQYAGEKIPFLEEAIATIPPSKKMYLEIKTGIEILPYLQQIIMNSGKKDQIIVCSFSLTVVSAFKKLMPEIPAFYITGTLESDQQLIQKAKSNNLDGLSVIYQYITPSLATTARDANLQLIAWVVDDSVTAIQLHEYVINGVITDKPDQIMTALQ